MRSFWLGRSAVLRPNIYKITSDTAAGHRKIIKSAGLFFGRAPEKRLRRRAIGKKQLRVDAGRSARRSRGNGEWCATEPRYPTRSARCLPVRCPPQPTRTTNTRRACRPSPRLPHRGCGSPRQEQKAIAGMNGGKEKATFSISREQSQACLSYAEAGKPARNRTLTFRQTGVDN